MAVRQYVGARYVPKFFENSQGTAEWQSGTAYEPLTIVTWNGNSFTSKKFVPATAGAPNIETGYWISTGVYNQQIEEYRQETQEAREEAAAALEAATDAGTVADRAERKADAVTEDLAPILNSYEKIISVGKNGEGRFTTIAAALAEALETPTTRTAIIIFPGIYEETLDMHSYTPSDLALIGLGTAQIRSSASWPNAPMYVAAGYWTFRNINFASIGATGSSGAYALHADPVAGAVKCYGCEFTSTTNAGAGVGMAANGTAIFENCLFHTSVNHAFYLHNRALANQNNQTVVLDKCRFEGQNGRPCIRIDDAAKLAGYTGSICGVSVYNCTGYLTPKVEFRKTSSQTLDYLDTDYTGIFLQTTSYSPGIPGLTYTNAQTPTGINAKCNVHNINYCRCGNIVNVNLDFTATEAFSSNERIIENGLPAPANTVVSTLNSFESDSSGAFIQMTAGIGSVTSFGIVSGKRYCATFTYICKYI